MNEVGTGRTPRGQGESEEVVIPYPESIVDKAEEAMARLRSGEELGEEERIALLNIMVRYVQANGALSSVIDILIAQPPDPLVHALSFLTDLGADVFRGDAPELDALAEHVSDLFRLTIVVDWDNWDGEFREPESFETISDWAGPVRGDLLRDLVEMVRCWPRSRPSLYWAVMDKLTVTRPPNSILVMLILCGHEVALEFVMKDATLAWEILNQAELYLPAGEWRQLALLLASTPGLELLSRDGDCHGLKYPWELLQADADRDGDGLGDICRVLAQVCRTEDEAEAAWMTFGLDAEDLLAEFMEADGATQASIIAFCSAIKATGAAVMLPPEIFVDADCVDSD